MVQLVHRPRISIHAPRTGSDVHDSCGRCSSRHFNPRSPHGERLAQPPRARKYHNFNPRSPHGERHAVWYSSYIGHAFQSTLPARGATYTIHVGDAVLAISIHAPRTGSDLRNLHVPANITISIHAPRTGSDARSATVFGRCRTFQSTLPARGATSVLRGDARCLIYFNPRSPHGERQRNPQRGWPNSDFNPRSPHGERQNVLFFASIS